MAFTDADDLNSTVFFRYFLIGGLPGLVLLTLCVCVLYHVHANFLLLPHFFATRSWRRFLFIKGKATKVMSIVWTVLFCLLSFIGVAFIVVWALLVCVYLLCFIDYASAFNRQLFILPRPALG